MTDRLAAVLADTTAVLLDFDGPVTPLLPSGPNRRLADATREPLRQAGITLPEPVANTSDHLSVLRFAADQAPTVLGSVERVALGGEVEAARAAVPTPGSADFLAACQKVGRPVVIVSNNAAEAIETYLAQHGLADKIAKVLGRPHGSPALMKPHPELVRLALQTLSRRPSDCVMIGDSVTDIEVSRTAGVRSIGYAKTPERGDELVRAGADAITDDMASLAAAVELAACDPPTDPRHMSAN
jgi:HAD superfamily hydrolase (TIGR01509 family)